jgi:hypothetical protein
MSTQLLERATAGHTNQVGNLYPSGAFSGSHTVVAVSPQEGVNRWGQPAYPDASQAWFWTAEWQAMEAEASEDIAHGRVKRFLDEDEFCRAIDELLSDADV